MDRDASQNLLSLARLMPSSLASSRTSQRGVARCVARCGRRAISRPAASIRAVEAITRTRRSIDRQPSCAARMKKVYRRRKFFVVLRSRLKRCSHEQKWIRPKMNRIARRHWGSRVRRRAFLAADGQDLTTSQLIRWVFPRQGPSWHSIYYQRTREAVRFFADPIGRAPGYGNPYIWRLKDEFRGPWHRG
jgi:hypothetical protein